MSGIEILPDLTGAAIFQIVSISICGYSSRSREGLPSARSFFLLHLGFVTDKPSMFIFFAV